MSSFEKNVVHNLTLVMPRYGAYVESLRESVEIGQDNVDKLNEYNEEISRLTEETRELEEQLNNKDA